MPATTPSQSSLIPRNPHLLAIAEALSAPFDAKDVKFKPQMVKNNRALAMAYIDARLIQDRLDRVLGVENWQDTYEILPDGSVMCRLKLRLGSRWITKADVGSPSEQPDSGDRLKAAFSDALKRAAVKFGIGRYLYRLHAQWVDYDPIKKQLIQLPHLPASALPKSVGEGTSEEMKNEKLAMKENASSTTPHPPTASAPESLPNSSLLPKSGQELHRRIQDYEAKLAARKLCVRGALLAHVTQAGVKAGYTANVTDWSGPAIPFAVEAVKEFEQSMRASGKPEPKTAA